MKGSILGLPIPISIAWANFSRPSNWLPLLLLLSSSFRHSSASCILDFVMLPHMESNMCAKHKSGANNHDHPITRARLVGPTCSTGVLLERLSSSPSKRPWTVTAITEQSSLWKGNLSYTNLAIHFVVWKVTIRVVWIFLLQKHRTRNFFIIWTYFEAYHRCWSDDNAAGYIKHNKPEKRESLAPFPGGGSRIRPEFFREAKNYCHETSSIFVPNNFAVSPRNPS